MTRIGTAKNWGEMPVGAVHAVFCYDQRTLKLHDENFRGDSRGGRRSIMFGLTLGRFLVLIILGAMGGSLAAGS